MMAPVPYPARTYSEMYIGQRSPVMGFTPYAPEKTPVTVWSIMRSRSVRPLTYFTYSSTACCCSGVVTCPTSSDSGARTKNVTPNIVSARVVKIVKLMSLSATLMFTSVPSERPIQFFCVSFIESLHCIVSSPSRRRWL